MSLEQHTPYPTISDAFDIEPDASVIERVMVVEDNPAEQARLAALLDRLGFSVTLASDGAEALQLLRKSPIRIIISDWQMPRLTGVELCRILREDPAFQEPFVILVTGRDTTCDLVAGMDSGADDFITKPFSSEELRVRLGAGVRTLKLRDKAEQHSRQLDRSLQREAQANRQLRRDHEAAAALQWEMIPDYKSPFSQIEMAGLFLPADRLAGDGYGYYPLDDRHMAFYHIDVSGHGVAAAMLCFSVTHLLSSHGGGVGLVESPEPMPILQDDTISTSLPVVPSQVVQALNRYFVQKNTCDRYFTMIYGVIDVFEGTGYLCQAGHPSPLVIDREGRSRYIGNGGYPVGMLAEAEYENIPITVPPGGRLCLYSDGISECRNPQGLLFGKKKLSGLMAMLSQMPASSVPEIIKQQLAYWQEAGSNSDDISMFLLDRTRKT